MLTKTDRQIIDRALADKRSPQYQQGYDAAVREIQILKAGGLSCDEIVARMSETKVDCAN
jgi:hypothetical protein